MDLNQYLSMFIDEANDHLQALNENMLELENNPDDIGIVQIIFRSAHTLKGMSATMGFEDLASLTHQMENVLDMIRNHQLKMDEFIFDTLFRSLDSLEAMVADITQGGEGKADVTQILAALKSIETGEYRTASSREKEEAGAGEEPSGETLDEFQRSILEQSLESGMNVYHLRVRLRDDCVLKAVRAYMVFQVLGQHGKWSSPLRRHRISSRTNSTPSSPYFSSARPIRANWSAKSTKYPSSNPSRSSR